MKKRFFATIIGFFTLMFSQLVTAALPTTAGGWFKYVITFAWLQDIGFITHAVDPLEGFIRFLLLITFFLVLFKGAQLLKLGTGSAVAIALVFSLIGMIFVPGTIILAAAASYGTIFSLIILGLPVLLCVGMYFFLRDHVWMRTIVVGMLWLILSQMWRHMVLLRSGATAGFQPTFTTVASWIGWVQIAVAIFFLISLIQAIASLSSGHPGSELDLKGTAQLVMNKIGSRSRRMKTFQMNQYIEDQKELEDLEKADTARRKALELVEAISASKQIRDVAERNRVETGVGAIKKELETAKREFSRVKSRTFRTQRAITGALNQLKTVKGEMKDKEKDIETLEVLEKTILEKHKEAEKGIDSAIGEYAKAAGAARVIRNIPDAQLPPAAGAVALNFGTSKSALATSVKSAVTNLLNALTAMQTHLETAETAQKEVLQAMQGATLEARELMKWKD